MALIEIVDLPNLKMVIFYSDVSFPEDIRVEYFHNHVPNC